MQHLFKDFSGVEIEAKPILKMTVLSGPDAGKVGRFSQEVISLGRDRGNDFFLRDRFVSNHHGEFIFKQDAYIYQDLQSRHGSLVIADHQAGVRLHHNGFNTAIELRNEGEIQVGSTVIQLEVLREKSSQLNKLFIDSSLKPSNKDTFITTAHAPHEALNRRVSGADPRLEVLFKLAGQLNGLNRLDDILDLVVELVFETFPTADFFAISLLEDETLKTFMSRIRGDSARDAPTVISQSLLKRVVSTREAVLFVRDGFQKDLSLSILEGDIYACLAAPLVGQRSLLGVVHIDTRNSRSLFSRQDLDLFTVFASNTAFAIERTRLTENIYKMFEGFVQASVSAIEVRDPTTAGHSERVAAYSMRLAEQINEDDGDRFRPIIFTPAQLTELRYAALLPDFGKVAVRESVLMKPTRLGEMGIKFLRERLNNIKQARWQRQLSVYLNKLTSENKPPNSKALSALQANQTKFVNDLEAFFGFISRINSSTFVGPAERERILKLGRQKLLNADGENIQLLSEEEIENLIITKGTLNDAEIEEIRAHVSHSEAFLKRIPWSEDLCLVPCIAGAHHEKLDGSGYPRGISGDELSIRARVLTIADIFDAVTAWDRPYRPAATIEEASRILRAEASEQKLDDELVEMFIKVVIPDMAHVIPKQS